MLAGIKYKWSYIQTIDLFNNKIGYAIPILLFGFIIIEWVGREQQYAIMKLGVNWNRPLRWLMYWAIIFVIFWFGGKEQQFVYFQF